ncbi:MAG: S8 family serine peptidase [Bacteroidales bacterium]
MPAYTISTVYSVFTGLLHMFPRPLLKFTVLAGWAFCSLFSVLAQPAEDVYRISFTGKTGTPFTLSSPENYLSPAAIQRRQQQGIAIDSLDLPVNPAYADSLSRMGFRILSRSRWMNSLVALSANPTAAETASTISFVREVEKISSSPEKKKQKKKWLLSTAPAESSLPVSEYGYAEIQTLMLRGNFLHGMGYRGQGITIAVIDGGFTGTDTYHFFSGTDIRGTRNFLQPEEDVYRYHSHGMQVLSVMAANQPGVITGTAPLASYWLMVSENTDSESPLEEELWISAAELADSAGAHIINTSLGYSTFDDPAMNHLPDEMDGNTTRISIAADIAASRGMVLVTSAGNEGNNTWKVITAPSDADSTLAVGAVDRNGIRTEFSSVGWSIPGKTKPDIMAMGEEVAQVIPGGFSGTANGTSFAAPLIAGLTACLWQAHPESTAMDILEAIRQSGHMAHNPDSLYGYGIPDFELAHLILSGIYQTNPQRKNTCRVYPNPFNDSFTIRVFNENGELISQHGERILIRVFSHTGQILWTHEIITGGFSLPLLRISVPGNLRAGLYILEISSSRSSSHARIVKKD